MNTFLPTKNQSAVLNALSDGEASAQEVARSKGVTAGQTSIYNSLRALRERGLVLEKKVKTGTTSKGDRFTYSLSAKGKRLIGA